MKKIAIYMYLALMLCIPAGCSDYLNVNNAGNTDDEFVTSTVDEAFKVLSYAYAKYRQDAANGGNYLYQDVLGSDAEYMSEYPTANNVIARLQPEAAAIGAMETQYNALNIVLAYTSRLCGLIEEKDEYLAAVAAGTTTDWTHLYGESKTLRGLCAWELVRHFGDVPFGYENQYVQEYELSSRFDIMDQILQELREVEGLMYTLGANVSLTAERITRTYTNALIGEIALHIGGWQTIRTDIDGLYGGVQFEYKGVDDGNCIYARRTDYLDYIKIAEQYLNQAVNTYNGTAKLITTDPDRNNLNPFQRHFQEINSRRISPESLFEVGCVAGVGNAEHPYSMGRPGSNSSNMSILNTFAAIRIIPTFFYNAYEPGDKRRDASMVVTGSDAASGQEVLMPLGVGTRVGGGGPSINKWDMNRGDVPNFPNAGNRSSGMNYVVMRMADAMLMLAEAKAILGTDNAGAITLVNQIRERAFGNSDNNISGLSGESLLDAIYAERKLELLGEGDLRWDMIRSGKFNERAVAVRQEMKDMIAGLQAEGFYVFPSGRTISNYIWTKHVDLAAAGVGIVTQEGDENDPALYPGWRGIYNWGAEKHEGYSKNLAIKGLYEYIDPEGDEAKALEREGYTRVDWGINTWNDPNTNAMLDGAILDGVEGRTNMAPRYYHSMPITVISQSKGAVKNGYGLPNN